MIRSRPPPPGSAAHRRLEAERRYSSSPRQRRSGTPGTRARARFPHIFTRFLRPRPVGLLKDLAGESLRGGEKKAGECEARWCNHPPSLSHLAPFQSAPSNILRDLKTKQESRLLSAGGSLHRVPELLEVQRPQLSGLCCVRVRDTSGSSKGRSARTGNYLSLSHQRAAWWEFLPLFSVSVFSFNTVFKIQFTLFSPIFLTNDI